MLAVDRQRHLVLEGAYNVRDIGGYVTVDDGRTRWHTLLRGDSLHRLSVADQAALLAYGVCTSIDLRGPAEMRVEPSVFRVSEAVTYHHMPLLGDPGGDGARDSLPALADIYHRILDSAQERLAQVLRTLAQPRALPALVHCTAGKDRTGLVVALLLAIAGVPAPTIAADYALSDTYLGPDFRAEARKRALAAGLDWNVYQQLLICPPELMLDALAYLDERYDGVQGYVRTIGLTEAEVDALRDALTERV
jgi:protein-tyrosine phosphatase